MAQFDMVVKGGDLIIPLQGRIQADLGIKDGRIAAIAQEIDGSEGAQIVDASGKVVFPGAIDSHSHIGIYRPLSEDAASETASAASGGVTTICSYFRTGNNYLNKTGAFKDIFPELLQKSADSFRIDYAYHIACMSSAQIDEIEWLVKECGVSTFKYYMFYKSLDLSGAKPSGDYLMLGKDVLDFGFLYRFMSEIARINQEFENDNPIRLSIHCENPEIIATMSAWSKMNPTGNLMKDYSNGRPSWQEALAIKEVALLADQTGCPVNLLHLSSADAVNAGLQVMQEYMGTDFLLEVTLHHLAMSNENDYGALGKVNPPVRGRDDVEYLWQAVLDGLIETVVSDHACHPKDMRQGDLWDIMPGFGGTGLMFPVMITEGYHKRGMDLTSIAEMTAYNPAVRHNLHPKKGSIAIGCDADLVILDLDEEKTVTTEILQSAQDYTPFEGLKLKGWPAKTIVRGKIVFEDGKVIGEPGYGQYIKRPIRP
jgi:dihydroorotase-like cyclic amidohydrolase